MEFAGRESFSLQRGFEFAETEGVSLQRKKIEHVMKKMFYPNLKDMCLLNSATLGR